MLGDLERDVNEYNECSLLQKSMREHSLGVYLQWHRNIVSIYNNFNRPNRSEEIGYQNLVGIPQE